MSFCLHPYSRCILRFIQFPAPIIASTTPLFGNATELSSLNSRPVIGALPAGVEKATEQISSPTGVFTPFPDLLQQQSDTFASFPGFLPSGSFTPISSASQNASTSTEDLAQPFWVHADVTGAPPPSDALDLDWLIRFLQLPPPANPQAAPSSLQRQVSFLQTPSLRLVSPLNNELYNPSTSGSSEETSSSPSSAVPSNSAPWSPGSQFLYPSPESEGERGGLLGVDNEGHGSPSLSQPQALAGPIRRPRTQTTRDPLYSTGQYKCRYHGCPWRFRNARMCNRHEQTHNEANAYFCCNPRCSTNTGKRKAGFPRRDSIRRHYAKKSADDPCLVMARSLGWTGELIYEEEMFTVPPIPAFES